jgi:hypothetical protein
MSLLLPLLEVNIMEKSLNASSMRTDPLRGVVKPHFCGSRFRRLNTLTEALSEHAIPLIDMPRLLLV